MSAEDNKAKVRRLLEHVVNGGNLDAVDDILAVHFVFHDPLFEGPCEGGHDDIKNIIAKIRTAFPNVHLNVEDQIAADNDSVVTRWTGTGTHEAGIESSNREGETQLIELSHVQVELHGTSISHFSAGKIDGIWNVMVDTLERNETLNSLPTESRRCSWFCHAFPRCCR